MENHKIVLSKQKISTLPNMIELGRIGLIALGFIVLSSLLLFAAFGHFAHGQTNEFVMPIPELDIHSETERSAYIIAYQNYISTELQLLFVKEGGI